MRGKCLVLAVMPVVCAALGAKQDISTSQ